MTTCNTTAYLMLKMKKKKNCSQHMTNSNSRRNKSKMFFHKGSAQLAQTHTSYYSRLGLQVQMTETDNGLIIHLHKPKTLLVGRMGRKQKASCS